MSTLDALVITDRGGRVIDQAHLSLEGLERATIMRLSGREAMNELTSFVLDLSIEDASLDPRRLLDQDATLSILDAAGEVAHRHLVVLEVSHDGTYGNDGRYRVVLGPALARLALVVDHAVFQDRTTQEIVAELLARAGFPSSRIAWRLRGRYAKRVYTVQYGESGLSFMTRLLGDEGINHWIDRSGDDSTLIFGDHAGAHEGIEGEASTISFEDESGMNAGERSLHGLERRWSIVSTRVVVRDVDVEHPRTPIDGEAGEGRLEVFEVPSKLLIPEAAAARARVRLEQLGRHRTTLSARSADGRLRPGRVVEVVGAADDCFSGRFLITSVDKHDGASTPVEAWQSIEHWLEKTHQLGLSGPLGAERWAKLDRPTRELYWDRARSLSVDHEDYEGAAALFRESIERFDRNDAYSWHYLGFNLDRAGVRRREAERALRKAVELKRDHPWYNGRLVTFLIDQARFREAEEEWRKALQRMDPAGENVLALPWLAREAHRWVVKAWLKFGEVQRAREVFNEIPEETCDEDWYRDLRDALEDAEEALRLGESVYPSTTPMAERWKLPREVAGHDAKGRPLRSWLPGRVVAVDEAGLHLALAIPEGRRVVARTISYEEWAELGFCVPAEADGQFLFLAIYEDEDEPKGAIVFVTERLRTVVDCCWAVPLRPPESP